MRVRWETVLVGLLLLGSVALRIYKVGSIPDTVLADEAENAQDAVRILHGLTPEYGIFGFDWTQQPAFSAYKLAAFIGALGFKIWVIRLPSVLSSTLALLAFYLLCRRQFSAAVALLGTLLLSTSVWYLNFSRSAWNNVDICLYGLAAMLFLEIGISAVTTDHAQRRGWLWFGLAGLSCALALYGYPSGRAIPVTIAAFFPIVLLLHRKHASKLIAGYAVLAVTAGLAFAPTAVIVARNWAAFNSRTNVVFVFNNAEFKADPVSTMIAQLGRNLRGPWDGSVNNTPQYSPLGEPQLDPATGLFTAAGMVLTMAMGRYRRHRLTWLWWLMLLAGWGSTQLLTVATPNGARGVGYMPTLLYFAMVGIAELFRVWPKAWARIAPARSSPVRFNYSGHLILSAALFLLGLVDAKHYFDWQNDPKARLARYEYITAREFPAWAEAIQDLAREGRRSMNVGRWREMYPIQDRGNPYAIPD